MEVNAMQRALPSSTGSAIPQEHHVTKSSVDLYVCEMWGLAVLLSVTVPSFPAPLRFTLGLAAGLLGPGYVLVQLLFPRREQLAGVERVGMILLGSVIWILAWTVLLAEVGVRLDVMSAAIGLSVPLILGAEGLRWRRRGIPTPDLYNVSLPHGLPKGVLAAVAGVILLTAVVTASTLNRESLSLSITDTQGQFTQYPASVLPNTTYPLTVHVNHLNSGQSYRVMVLVGTHVTATWDIPAHHGVGWSHTLRLTGPSSRRETKVVVHLFQTGSTTPIRTVWVQYR